MPQIAWNYHSPNNQNILPICLLLCYKMKQQVNSLTATRAVAAIMVVIHHFGYGVFPFSLFPGFFHSGNIAISYFFVLSGFVLYLSYENKKISYPDYVKRRIGRIVPVYMLALLLFIIVAFAYYDYRASSNLIKQIIYCAFMIQAYFPQYALALNSPSWTISVEMLFYLLFPLFLLIQKKAIKLFVTATVLLFISSQVVHIWYYNGGVRLSEQMEGLAFYLPFIHISQFLMGMIAGYNMKAGLPRHRYMPLFLFALIILAIAFRPAGISYHVGLLDPLFMYFILSVAINDPRFLNSKPFVFLGEISYGIYILQWPVYKFLDAVNSRRFHIPHQYFFFISLIILVLSAAASYVFLEKPLRNKINSIKLKRATTALV
jgi:peptidoglycan/LPS O-acetylase OafA/YrhL